MEFIVDKENCTVKVIREFSAPQSDVWAAWTEREILDQWWGPHPWKSVTKTMDFTEGGKRLYAMVGPNGEEHWALSEFTSITPKTNFKVLGGFCDSQGIINQEMPRANWNIDFFESNGKTTVKVLIKHKTLDDLEMQIQMGFKEGFIAILEQLSNLLKKQ